MGSRKARLRGYRLFQLELARSSGYIEQVKRDFAFVVLGQNPATFAHVEHDLVTELIGAGAMCLMGSNSATDDRS